MVGNNKIKFINEKLNIFEFDYFGNSKKDLPIWDYTKKIIYTNASSSLKKIIKSKKIEIFEIKEIFSNR